MAQNTGTAFALYIQQISWYHGTKDLALQYCRLGTTDSVLQ